VRIVSRVEVLIESAAVLGEGPRWDAVAQRLLWVDIKRGELHVWDGVDRAVELGTLIGSATPTDSGEILVALADRLALVGEAGLRDLVSFPHGPALRANDGACDREGRLWIGTMMIDESPGGALYRYDGALERVLDGVGMSNGIGWSPDGTRMYYIDSLAHRVDVFDYDGDISNRRRFVAFGDEGTPDGLAVDDEGGVWVAFWGGHSVRRYDAAGVETELVSLPAKNVTACCFRESTLVITTAAPDGRVYAADVGVSGPPAQPFRSTAPSDAEPTSAR
jgi:sugar lactone lactonase YvrE